MTKQREIELLDGVTKQLGPQSYLGPWLSDLRPAIVRDIESDFPIDEPRPSVARREAQEILREARVEAAKILATATKAAADEIEKARKHASEIRQRTLGELDRLRRVAEGY